jgi:hypothetical protein
MISIKRIARRVASFVEDLNYAQRKSTESFLSVDANRR